MKKRYMSIVLAALIVASSLPLGATAASIEEQPSAAEKGTFFFDGGDGWDNKTVCFYVWDDTTHEHAQKDGWAADDNWGAVKKIGATKLGGSRYESYEIDLTGREDHAIFAIFHCRETGEQTMNCIINSSVFGTTAKRNGVMYENPVDSEKTAEGVEFDGGTGVGIEKLITSSGKIQGDIIAPGKTPDGIVAQFVLDNYGMKEKLSGEDIVTEKSVADAIKAFDTTKEAVWAKYQTFSGSEKYNAEEAEKVIMGTGAEPEPEPEPKPEPTTTKGTFKFDGGDGWDNKTVCFYIWDDTTHEHAQKDGWAADDNWGSVKKIGGTNLGGSLYESYEIDLTGREDHAIFAIFHCRDTGDQTMNCLINASVFGTTAKRNGVMYENPVDSEKTAEGVEFDGGTGVGIEKMITSSGKIQGDIIAPGKTPDGIVAQFVLDYYGKKEKLSGEDIVTAKSVADAIKAFDTTKEAVWAKYQTFSGSANYNAEEAEKVIMGTGAEPEPQPKVMILGDVDGDGKITSADSLYILRRSVQLEPENADIDKLCDVNSDGGIKSDDALEVLRASVQIPSSYPIGQAVS